MSVLTEDVQSALGYMGWPGLARGSIQFRWAEQALLEKVLSFSILVLSIFEKLIQWLIYFLHRNHRKGSNSKSDLGWRCPVTQFYSSEYAKEHYFIAGNHSEKEFPAVAPKCHSWTQVSAWIPFMTQPIRGRNLKAEGEGGKWRRRKESSQWGRRS